MKEYEVYKKKSNNIHLSNSVAESIKIYCLSQMVSSADAYAWRIGITSDENFTMPNGFRKWVCQSYLEALHTARYFIEQKGMPFNTPDTLGSETIIYLFR